MLHSLCFWLCVTPSDAHATPKHNTFRDWADQLERICNCTVSLVSRAAMPQARYGHTSILHDNAVFMFGGRIMGNSDNAINSEEFSTDTRAYLSAKNRLAARDSWMYNITTGQWKVLEFSEKYYTPRLYASSFIYDDKIHIVGGRVDSIDRKNPSAAVTQEIPDRIDVFHTKNMQWEKPKRFRVLNSYFPSVSGSSAVMPIFSQDSLSKESMLFLLGGYNAEALENPSTTEVKRSKTLNKPVSSALTKKYGYYAFHPRNFTQAHVFPAFDALPVFGHQMLVGPDRTLLVLGGFQRASGTTSDSLKQFEEMISSNKVHLIRHDTFFQNHTVVGGSKWPVSTLPPMRHQRAHFGAVRLRADAFDGESEETADLVLAFGGTDQGDTQHTVDSAEILNLRRPEKGWRAVCPESCSDDSSYGFFPSHLSIAQASHREFTGMQTFIPVQRVVISGGVSAAQGYHRELIAFDVKFGERRDEKRRESTQSRLKRQFTNIEKILIGVVICAVFWIHKRAHNSMKRLRQRLAVIKRRLVRLFEEEEKLVRKSTATSIRPTRNGIERFFSDDTGEDTAQTVEEKPLSPPFGHSAPTSRNTSMGNGGSIVDLSSSQYFDSLSSAHFSADTFDFTPSLGHKDQLPGPHRRQRQIPPQSAHDTTQISHISMPSANVSLSSLPQLSLDMRSVGSLSASNRTVLKSSQASEISPRLQPKKNPNTNVYSDYQLINEIGSGEDAVVYTAVLVSGELVAVKVIRDTTIGGESDSGNLAYYPFTHEAQVLLSLPPHPNLIQFYAIFPHREKQQIHIVMELVEAGSLHSLLTKITTPFSLATIRKYTQQLIEGLNHLHANGVVHCDIKGENVLIGREGQLKLTDFGQSRRIPEASAQSDTMDNAIHADVWLLGCTIMEMIYRGANFVPTYALSNAELPRCVHGHNGTNLSDSSTPQRRTIHCSCCPCLLHYESIIRARFQASSHDGGELQETPDLPFELPEAVDPTLFNFLKECFRVDHRPTLDDLASHPFLGGSRDGKRKESGEESHDESEKGTSPRPRSITSSPRSTEGTERTDFSASLGCTIYDF